MIKYQMYTKDTSHEEHIQSALSRNMEELPNRQGYRMARKAPEGDKKEMWWIYPALTAMESGFPAPICKSGNVSLRATGKCNVSWQSLAINAFEEHVERWNAEKTTCNGGLRWQLKDPGYKNTVTNGGFFQIAARLARYTGNETFADWATTVWEWTTAVELLETGEEYHVHDGAEDREERECSMDGYFQNQEWSHTLGLYLQGAANMYAYSQRKNVTASRQNWTIHVDGLVRRVQSAFSLRYKKDNTSIDVIYENMCELTDDCSEDQMAFKSTLVQALSRTMMLVPSVMPRIAKLINATSVGASSGCSTKTEDKNACGFKWYTGRWDQVTKFGAQVSSLEAVLGALVGSAPLATM
jgi:mannan endo-1,6-alpha-mannosidase